MSRQRPYVQPSDDSMEQGHIYKKTLFVREGLAFSEVRGRVIEPYSPPTPAINVAKLDVSGGPSHIHHGGVGVYKIVFSLLFTDRMSYVTYMANVQNLHKFYDERGQIFTGAPEDVKPRVVEANRGYVVDVTMVAIKKDAYDLTDVFDFQDIEGHWAEEQIREMTNLGLLSVVTNDGDPVLSFRPNDLITRGEFIAILNRTRRLLETSLRG